jgi:cell division protein FtsZ
MPVRLSGRNIMATDSVQSGPDAESDPLYEQACAVARKSRRVSVSLLQRHLCIGYTRAGRLLERMEQAGLTPVRDKGRRDAPDTRARHESSSSPSPGKASASLPIVIGMGGAGVGAVERMIRGNVKGVGFIAADTDAEALAQSTAGTVIPLGKTGVATSAGPDAGREAALEARGRLAEALRDAEMVLVLAGMGGGAGTGAAPVIAEAAREAGAFTIAMATRPFVSEARRNEIAEAGFAELLQHVDSLIVIPNEKQREVLGDGASMEEAFKAADKVLCDAAAGILELVAHTRASLIRIDAEDMRDTLGKTTTLGIAQASGADRARIAAERAIASPLSEGFGSLRKYFPNDRDISGAPAPERRNESGKSAPGLSGARAVLVGIAASHGLVMKEVKEVMKTVRESAAEDARILFGVACDADRGDELRVTILAGCGEAVRPDEGSKDGKEQA